MCALFVPGIVFDAHLRFVKLFAYIQKSKQHIQYIYNGNDLFIQLSWEENAYKKSIPFIPNTRLIIPHISNFSTNSIKEAFRDTSVFLLEFESSGNFTRVLSGTNRRVVGLFKTQLQPWPSLVEPKLNSLDFAIYSYSNTTVHLQTFYNILYFLKLYVAKPTKTIESIETIYKDDSRFVNIHVGGDNETTFIQAVGPQIGDNQKHYVTIKVGLYPIPINLPYQNT